MTTSNRPVLVPVRAAQALRQYALVQSYRLNLVCILGGVVLGVMLVMILKPELGTLQHGVNGLHMVLIVALILCFGIALTPLRDPRGKFDTDYSTVHTDNLLVVSEKEMQTMRNDMGLCAEDIKRMENYVTTWSNGAKARSIRG